MARESESVIINLDRECERLALASKFGLFGLFSMIELGVIATWQRYNWGKNL